MRAIFTGYPFPCFKYSQIGFRFQIDFLVKKLIHLLGKLGVWNRNDPNKDVVMFTKQQTLIFVNNTAQLFIY